MRAREPTRGARRGQLLEFYRREKKSVWWECKIHRIDDAARVIESRADRKTSRFGRVR
jgi:hypothetical protein